MITRIAGAYRAAFTGLPRQVWILALASLVNRSGTMVLPFLGLYLTTRLGFSVLEAGHVLSLYGLGALLGAWLWGDTSPIGSARCASRWQACLPRGPASSSSGS